MTWVKFSCSVVSDSVTPWTVAHQASLSITNSLSLPKLISFELVMPSNHLILCHPLLLPPSIFPRFFTSAGQSIGVSVGISSSNEYLALISFRIYWFDLLAIQETLKSLLQHHSLKASIFQLSALLMVQLSHPYMTTEKNIALTSWIFVGNVMSLLFNMMSRFVIAFLPRRKYLLILCLQSPSTAVLEARKMKSVTVYTFPPSTCNEVMGSGAWSKFFECWVSSQLFQSPLSLSSRGSLVSLHFMSLEWYRLHIWGCYFSWQSWFQLVIYLARHFIQCTLHMS